MKSCLPLLLQGLLALCCLASPGQLHGLLHHEDGGPDPVSGVEELHDGDCSHFPDREVHGQECGLCQGARNDVRHDGVAMAVTAAPGTAAVPVDGAIDRTPASVRYGAHGARAPPRLG